MSAEVKVSKQEGSSVLILNADGTTLYVNEQAKKTIGANLNDGLRTELLTNAVTAVIDEHIETPIKIYLSEKLQVLVTNIMGNYKLVYAQETLDISDTFITAEELFFREVLQPVQLLLTHLQPLLKQGVASNSSERKIKFPEEISLFYDYLMNYKTSDRELVCVKGLIETVKNNVRQRSWGPDVQFNTLTPKLEFKGNIDQLSFAITSCLQTLIASSSSENRIYVELQQSNNILNIILFNDLNSAQEQKETTTLHRFPDNWFLVDIFIGLHGGLIDCSSIGESSLILIQIPISDTGELESTKLSQKQLDLYAKDVSKLTHASIAAPKWEQLERYAMDLAQLTKKCQFHGLSFKD